MVGCHLARDGVDRLQKGLRFRFLESHGLTPADARREIQERPGSGVSDSENFGLAHL